MEKQSVFETLSKINVDDKVEKKNGLKYLSWAYSWSELKKVYPASTYKVIKNEQGWNYHTDNRSCWVEVSVTVEGLEHTEMLPIMNFKNQSISLNAVSSMDVNKAIQRALTKCIARHGMGINIYIGEDFPEETDGHNLQVCLGDAEIEHLQKLFKKIPSYYKTFLKQFNIKDLRELPEDKFDTVVEVLNKRIELAEKQGK